LSWQPQGRSVRHRLPYAFFSIQYSYFWGIAQISATPVFLLWDK
jgi:hypothetical protein